MLLHCLPYLGNVSIVSLNIAVQVSIYIKGPFIISDQLLTYMTHLKISKTHFGFPIEKKATTSLEECFFFFFMSMTFFHAKIDSDLFSFLYLTNLKQPEKKHGKKVSKTESKFTCLKENFPPSNDS